MSLTDELFSCLESERTDSRKSSSECRRSKSNNRTQSYLVEQDERPNSNSGSSSRARHSSQEHRGHESMHDAGHYKDTRSDHYSRNDYGHLKYEGKERKGANDSVVVGKVGRDYDRRSGSVSSRREPARHFEDGGEHMKRDRSEDTRSSKYDLHTSRNYVEQSKQANKYSKNFVDDHGRECYRPGEVRSNKKEYSDFDDKTPKSDHKNKTHSNDSSNVLPQRKLQIDKKHIEDRGVQNCADGQDAGRPSKCESNPRKGVKKHTKLDDCVDDVPFKLINYRKLEDLVNGYPTELVVALANRHSGFENRLSEKLSPDFIILIIKALAKLCKADFHENKVGILSQALELDFLNQISQYLMKLPFESEEKRRSKIDEFLTNMLTFFKTAMDLLPDKACDKLPNMLDTMERAMRCIEACQAKKFPDALNEGLLDLDCRLKVRISEQEIRRQKPATSGNTVEDEAPPDNFRNISIYPTPKDILDSDATFIRANIVKGAYSSVEHYLDIQFRLLREDFVCPLREGITDYMNSKVIDGTRKKRINNVRIYRKVRFIAPKVVKDVVGLEICFDSGTHCSKVRWEHNKRFMYGSLLCFSKDNFVNIFFGTVVDRNIESLKKGCIVVELRQTDNLTDNMFQSEFIMAESEVYFEPYFHVLKALQKLEANSFPMRQYIVDVDIQSTPPIYLQSQPNFLYNISDHNVSVLEDATWPKAEELNLDDSQYNAFKSALTKAFVVIQGPPGTGKTYIGLKIAEVLLRNSPIWNASKKPILVVCYTNHALDQFLEGILAHTKNIVRVGGQSKSEVLSEFNLRERRRKNVRNADVSMLMRDIHNNMSRMMRDIKLIQVDLESINSGKGVISLHTLKAGGIRNRHISNFFTSDGKIDDEIFLEWLEIGMQYSDEPQFLGAEQQDDMKETAECLEIDSAELEGDPNEGIWQNAFDDPIDFIFDAVNITTHVKFALQLDTLREDISLLYKERAQMDAANDPALRQKCFQLDREIQEYHKCMNYWQNCVRSSGRCDDDTAERLLLSENLWQLSPNERWIIYNHWVSNLKKRMLHDLRTLEHELRTNAKRYEEVKQIGDREVMKNALVVGMTTSGAARLQPLLQALKPRIVIVEEAAEVMESHIVVSLTSECQHLILIGDHKQLRPNTAVYKLAREYNFDISLFERMLKNGMHCETLKVQHRMRPEIAQLIVPTIYPELHNHESVMKHKPVVGVTKSVYFVTHNNPEEMTSSIDKSEKSTETGKAVNDINDLLSNPSTPNTSTNIQQKEMEQSCSNTASNEKWEKNDKVSHLSSLHGDDTTPSTSTASLQSGLCKVSFGEAAEDKNNESAKWAVREVQRTPITINSTNSVRYSKTNDVCSDVNSKDKAEKGKCEENSVGQENSQENSHDILVGESRPESRPMNFQHSKLNQICSDKKRNENSEKESNFESLLDQSNEDIGIPIKCLPDDLCQRQTEAYNASKNQGEMQTVPGGSKFTSRKSSPLISQKQTLEFEEIYSRLEDRDVSFLKCSENRHNKGSKSYTYNEASMSPSTRRILSTDSSLQHDSWAECVSASGDTFSNREVRRKPDENYSDHESVSDAGSDQAVTMWTGGARRKVVDKFRVKSGKVGSRCKILHSDLQRLQIRNLMLQKQEMHNLKMKFEMKRQEEELKLLRLQQEYWEKKLSEL